MNGIGRPFHNIVTALIVGCPLMLPVLGQSQEKAKEPETETTLQVTVKRVIDGDSVLVLDPKDSNKEYEVQLEGLDAVLPEGLLVMGEEFLHAARGDRGLGGRDVSALDPAVDLVEL